MCLISCLPTAKLLVTCARDGKVFSFADALGHLADFFCARRDSSVAWTSADEKVAGHAASQHYGAACTLRLHHCLSMARGRGGGLAGMGARFYCLPAWFDNSQQKPDSSR